jgi:hypothetical protein
MTIVREDKHIALQIALDVGNFRYTRVAQMA